MCSVKNSNNVKRVVQRLGRAVQMHTELDSTTDSGAVCSPDLESVEFGTDLAALIL